MVNEETHMAKKELSDFNYDYQAYADYLESAECADDEGYDIYADANGNIYERTNGSWQIGHGHKNEKTNYDRKPDDERSIGRPWKNPWLKYQKTINVTQLEMQLVFAGNNNEEDLSEKNLESPKTFVKNRQKIII